MIQSGHAEARAEVQQIKEANIATLTEALALRGFDADAGTFTHTTSEERSAKLKARSKRSAIEVITTWTMNA
jgi:hypothetical protein